MPRRSNPVPKYRHHKASGQAVVTVCVNGRRKDVYLGVFGSEQSPRSRCSSPRIAPTAATDPPQKAQPTPNIQGTETTGRESFTLIKVLVIAAVVSFTTLADAAEPQVAFGVKVE